MQKYCYCKGEIILEDKARISPRDLGFIRGYAVFDVILIMNGKPFLLQEHWKRLKQSAQELLMTLPINERRWEEILRELSKKSNKENLVIRTIISGGEGSDSLSLGDGNIVMLTEEYIPYPSEIYEKGTKVITQEYQRQNPAVKSTSYIFPIRLQKEKKDAGAIEILYVLKGKVLEAATSNFFMVKNGVLITPMHNVLWGTTRNLVIQLAQENNILIEERDIVFEEIFEAEEAFLTASAKRVLPVIQVDEIQIGSGKVGGVTKKVIGLYQECIAKSQI